MLKLCYIVKCDTCDKEQIKEIVFMGNLLLMENPNVKKIWTPVLPVGWLFQPPKKAGNPENQFCSPQCKKKWNATH